MSLLKTSLDLTDCQQLIIKECIAGNRASQAKLYQLHARKMLGICLWYARNREEAEEILQDGFLRVFTYLHKWRAQGTLESWMRRIMVNAALNKYRNKSHLQIVEFKMNIHDTYEPGPLTDQMEVQKLVKLVQILPPAYRMVFNLFVFEGMKHREIALMLGISEGTSKSNLSDARVILQKALTPRKKIAL